MQKSTTPTTPTYEIRRHDGSVLFANFATRLEAEEARATYMARRLAKEINVSPCYVAREDDTF